MSNHTLDNLIIAYIGAAGREPSLKGDSDIINHLCAILPVRGSLGVTVLHVAVLVAVVEVGSSSPLFITQSVVEGV